MDPVRSRRPVMYNRYIFEIETGNRARIQNGVDQENQA